MDSILMRKMITPINQYELVADTLAAGGVFCFFCFVFFLLLKLSRFFLFFSLAKAAENGNG